MTRKGFTKEHGRGGRNVGRVCGDVVVVGGGGGRVGMTGLLGIMAVG